MMGVFQTLREKFRRWSATRGYACDACGKEIFTYPDIRLCEDCENTLLKNDGYTCPKCGRKAVADGVCVTCKSTLPSFTKGFAPFVYRSETSMLVNRIKNGNPRLAYYFGEKMAVYFLERFPKEELQKHLGEAPLLLVPIPLTPARQKTRGYNQAERLAEVVGESLQREGIAVEIAVDLLQKVKETGYQKELDGKARRENIEGAYRIQKGQSCRDRTVLLIDDILTTGATSDECAARLFKGKAKKVLLLVAAALPEKKLSE